MNQTKILEDVNEGIINSNVTGNPVDIRSLLGGVTEQDGRIVKAEVSSAFGGRNLTWFSVSQYDFRQLLYNGLDG